MLIKRLRLINITCSKYGNLLIFIDKFESIGDFVEIEYQKSNEEEVDKFINYWD